MSLTQAEINAEIDAMTANIFGGSNTFDNQSILRALALSVFQPTTSVPTTQTDSYVQQETDTSLIFNGTGGIVFTLLDPTAYPGRWLYTKNVAAFAVVSASANVVAIGGGPAGIGILGPVGGQWEFGMAAI